MRRSLGWKPPLGVGVALLIYAAGWIACSGASPESASVQEEQGEPLGDWREETSCAGSGAGALVALDEPESESIDGCAASHCVGLPEGGRACACASDAAREIRIERPGRQPVRWSTTFLMGTATDRFEVLVGDLDRDGSDELIAVNLVAIGMGMAVETYELAIIDGASGDTAPLRFRLEEYGRSGTFLRSAPGGVCRILATWWEVQDDDERGPGTYFIGQWFRYADGELRFEAGRPLLARRYLADFEQERWSVSGQDPARPYRWLNDQATQVLPTLPMVSSRTSDQVPGTIAAVSRQTLEIGFADGSRRFLAHDEWSTDALPSGSSRYWRLGDDATRRLYPEGYIPADPEAVLQGRRVVLATHQRRNAPVLVIWLR